MSAIPLPSEVPVYLTFSGMPAFFVPFLCHFSSFGVIFGLLVSFLVFWCHFWSSRCHFGSFCVTFDLFFGSFERPYSGTPKNAGETDEK